MEIIKTIYNDSQMTDSNSLAKALITKTAELSPVITHLAGKESEKFPLITLTEGSKNVISIDGGEYEYRIQTRMLRSRPLAATNSTPNAGIGNAPVKLVFPDKWFIAPYTLVSQSGILARISQQPVKTAAGYEYTVELVSPDPTQYIPAEDLQSGALWGMLWANVGTDFSRGNASNWSAPGLVRHKLGTLRKSYQMSGNAKNAVAYFKLPTKGGGSTNLWMEYEEYQKMLQWKQECELYYWYTEQTYTNNGVAHLFDENGQPVISGPGLLQQIVNKDTYSLLTENKLKGIIRDLFFGMTDGQNKSITLYTGTGGMDEFDRAMKDALGAQSYIRIDNGNFVDGSGRNLSYGGFFTQYKHVDGHVVNVVKANMFDDGPIAEASAKHPVTGLPMESYRMVFVDTSRYDGQNNVVMINRKGREMKRWAVAGAEVPTGFAGNDLRASDIDGASVHYLKTGAICLRRFDTSLDLRCVAAA